MKTASITTIIGATLISIILILKIWFDVPSFDLVFKLIASIAIINVLVVIIELLRREYLLGKKQKKDNYTN